MFHYLKKKKELINRPAILTHLQWAAYLCNVWAGGKWTQCTLLLCRRFPILIILGLLLERYLSVHLGYQRVSQFWNYRHQSHIIAHHHAQNSEIATSSCWDKVWGRWKIGRVLLFTTNLIPVVKLVIIGLVCPSVHVSMCPSRPTWGGNLEFCMQLLLSCAHSQMGLSIHFWSSFKQIPWSNFTSAPNMHILL